MLLSLKAGSEQSACSFNASGMDIHLITPVEQKTFWKDHYTLCCLINNYRENWDVCPPEVWLRSPASHWGSGDEDYYTHYQWAQVAVTLTPVRTEIVSLENKSETLAKSLYHNSKTNKKPLQCRSCLTQNITTTLSTTSSQKDTISFGQKLNYGVDFLGTGVKGETSLSYSHEWGKNETYQQSFLIGTQDELKFELEPGETGLVELASSRGILKARVTYKATLSGYVVVRFENPFREHYIWAYPVNNILYYNKYPLEHMVTQDITLDYYSSTCLKETTYYDPENTKRLDDDKVVKKTQTRSNEAKVSASSLETEALHAQDDMEIILDKKMTLLEA